MGNFSGTSILDVGCGVGGLYDYLNEQGVDCDYSGFDISEDMIRYAKNKHQEVSDRFILHDILHQTTEKKFDYVISNGPMNIKLANGVNDSMVCALVEQMLALSRIGIALSMTSALTEKPNSGTYYFDPITILAKVLIFCKNTRLDHTYLPHDFTIFCYNKSLYDF